MSLLFVVVSLMVFGFQPKALSVGVDTNVVQILDINSPAPTNSNIKVTSYTAVTNGVGGFNYYMYVESYTTNHLRDVWGYVTTNLVTGPWVKGDTSKVKYDVNYRSITNNYYYDRFLCIGGAEKSFFKPVLNPH